MTSQRKDSDDTLTLEITAKLQTSSRDLNDDDFFDIEAGNRDSAARKRRKKTDPEEEIKLKRVVTIADQKLKKKANIYLKDESFAAKYLNKGNVSNITAFVLMVIGIALFLNNEEDEFAKYILSLGLFSFSGGITNWLAIKMLFDRVPFLIGSGVILREFKSIRKTIKSVILEMFFDKDFLQEYLSIRSNEIIQRVDIRGLITVSLSNPKVNDMLVERIEEAASGKKVGNKLLKAILRVQNAEKFVKALKPVLAKMATEIVPAVVENVEFDKLVDVDLIEKEVDKLLTDKLELLTPEIVKLLMERVIREHLGWLVVWGNVFGGLIGVISQAVGFGP